MKLFHRLIADHEYSPTCSLSLNKFWTALSKLQRPKLFYFSFRYGYM